MATRILITGVCGFVGSSLARALPERMEGAAIAGIDNLSRQGSEGNRSGLQKAGVRFFHGDLRVQSDVEELPEADWVIDAAANPTVLAGLDRHGSSRQLAENNLLATVNVLEYCRRRAAGLILLSSSRVYSIPALASLPVREEGATFVLDTSRPLPPGASGHGVAETFPVTAPVSLYGSTKLASETLAREYGLVFGFPVWVNRCGVLAGAGQFGTPEQGIFSYWLHAHAARRPLRYVGFGGRGLQVRDAFHPTDLAALLHKQMRRSDPGDSGVLNVGGGIGNSISLARLTAWCDRRFGPLAPVAETQLRPYDVPWLVMDSALARERLGWQPRMGLEAILEEIARHTQDNPAWLERCGVA